jgi:hypothetical protein
MDKGLLGIYLNDHLAGSTAGRELVQRARASNEGTPYAEPLERLAREIAEDRESLIELMRRLGVRRDPLKQAAGWAAEKAGRLKPNGRLFSYSPLSRVVELEGLYLGVSGKRSLWRTLRHLAADEPRLALADYDGLIARADGQLRTLDRLRNRAAREAVLGEAESPGG